MMKKNWIRKSGELLLGGGIFTIFDSPGIFLRFYFFLFVSFLMSRLRGTGIFFVWVYGRVLGVKGFRYQEQQEGAERGAQIGIGPTLSTPINWRVCMWRKSQKCYHAY